MGNWGWKAESCSPKVECSPIGGFKLAHKFLRGLFEQPAPSALGGVDFPARILRQDYLILVDVFLRFRAASKPDGVCEVRGVMVVMVVGHCDNFGSGGCLLYPLPRLVPCPVFLRMRHQPKPWTESHPRVQEDCYVPSHYQSAH